MMGRPLSQPVIVPAGSIGLAPEILSASARSSAARRSFLRCNEAARSPRRKRERWALSQASQAAKLGQWPFLSQPGAAALLALRRRQCGLAEHEAILGLS
jgi:hypothetical protein